MAEDEQPQDRNAGKNQDGSAGEEIRDAARSTVDKANDATGAGDRLRNLMPSNGTWKAVVIPAAIGATAAAGYAAKKRAPKVEQKIGSKVASAAEKTADEAVSQTEQRGGIAGMAAKFLKGRAKGDDGGGGGGGITGAISSVASKVTGGGRSKEPSQGWGKGRRNPIQLEADVGVPRRAAYDQWTHLEEFPKFMHRVVSVQPDDDDRSKVKWQEKIWFSKRDWEAKVTEQIPDQKIAWKTVAGTSHVGHVTFHELDDELTKVLVNVDFNPSGIFEKMASGLRFVKRAAKSDVYRYKAFIETHGDATGRWRGRIENGEVVEDAEVEEGKPIEEGKELRTPGGKAAPKDKDSDKKRDENGDQDDETTDSGESDEDREAREQKRAEREERRRARERNGNGAEQEQEETRAAA